MLGSLPPELIICTLSFLQLQSLAALPRVAKSWNSFFNTHGSSIFRNAALLHKFIPFGDSALDITLKAHDGKLWEGVDSWKEFCKRRFQLEMNWAGRGRSVLRNMSSGRDDIHRMKVDERHGFFITTHIKGGLTVSNMFPTYPVWSLFTNHVRAHAHCEYENGFLIFDRPGNSKEVWRLISDSEEGETATHSPPDAGQKTAYEQACRQHPTTGSDGARGHFRPWALISYPEKTLAFRFVYPILLTSGTQNIYMHDVRTGELVRVLEEAVADSSPAWNMVTYLELNEKHVFVATEDWVRVFSKENGSVVMTLKRSDQDSYHHLTVSLTGDGAKEALSSDCIIVPQVLNHSRGEEIGSEFVAIHVSEDGKDMVLLREADITFLQDFERIARGEVSVSDIAVVFTHDHTEFIYLAVEHGKIVVAHASGICIFTADPAHHGLTLPSKALPDDPTLSPSRSFPRLSLCMALPLQDHPFLSSLSCLQMTQNRIYFTWDSRGLPSGIKLYEDREDAASRDSRGGMRLATEVPARIVFDAMIGSFPDHYWPSVGCIDLSIMPESWG